MNKTLRMSIRCRTIDLEPTRAMLKLLDKVLRATKGVCDQIPWQVVAFASAWVLRSGFQSVGTRSMEESEERYEVEVLRDPSIAKGPVFGGLGEQMVGRHFKGVTLVKKSSRRPRHAVRRSREEREDARKISRQ